MSVHVHTEKHTLGSPVILTHLSCQLDVFHLTKPEGGLRKCHVHSSDPLPLFHHFSFSAFPYILFSCALPLPFLLHAVLLHLLFQGVHQMHHP